nr:MAG TPA: hypothetical protein [Caudoviricetes sp.]
MNMIKESRWLYSLFLYRSFIQFSFIADFT